MQVQALSLELSKRSREALALGVAKDKMKLKLHELCESHNIEAADILSDVDPVPSSPTKPGEVASLTAALGEAGEEVMGEGSEGYSLSQAAMTDELEGLEESLGLKEQLLKR